MITLNANRRVHHVWRAVSRSARRSLVLGVGLAIGAGGLALGDIAVSPEGTPSGTVLVCTGNNGSMRYVGRGSCRRSERRLVLSDTAPLIVSLPSLGGNMIAESPGVTVSGPAIGTYRIQLSARSVKDIRRCAYIATPTVALQSGQITHAAQVAEVVTGFLTKATLH